MNADGTLKLRIGQETATWEAPCGEMHSAVADSRNTLDVDCTGGELTSALNNALYPHLTSTHLVIAGQNLTRIA